MKTLIFCLCLLVPLASAQERKRGIVIEGEADDARNALISSLYDNSYAILVGINKYSDEKINRLDYACADAKALKDLLTEKFSFPEKNVQLLLDDKATLKNIKDAIGKLYGAEENSRVIFFFAGHGETVTLRGGGEMGFLLPYDGNVSNDGTLYSSCLPMSDMKSMSTFVPSKHALFLIDACYGGLSASTRALSRETKLFLDKITKATARQIITAGGKGEQVVEKPEWGHSAFTKCILEGLGKRLADMDGDNLVTATELAGYLRKQVTANADNHQTPVYSSFTPDEGEFVFVLDAVDAPISININTSVNGAQVFVNNEKKGDTESNSLAISLKRGKQTLLVSKEGYKNEQRVIDVREENPPINIDLKPIVGILELNSEPSGASVSIDGKQAGKTPMKVSNLLYGPHKVNLAMKDYKPGGVDFDVTSEEPISQTVTLQPTPELNARLIYQSKLSARSTLMWSTGGASVVSGALAVVFHLDANKKYDAYSSAKDPAAAAAKYDEYNNVTQTRNIAIGAAVLFAGLSLYYYLNQADYNEIYQELQKQDVTLDYFQDNKTQGVRIAVKL